MLMRFLAKNVYSFKEETEFNLFPNKTQRLSHHKITNNNIDSLRLTAIYGANGSGKSNLIKAISLLDEMVEDGKLIDDVTSIKFRLKEENLNIPVSLAIEFFANSKIYYYTITFNDGVILNEYLAESSIADDILIFDRNFEDDHQKIIFFDDYIKDEKNKLFIDILAEKLIGKDELLLSFLYTKYKEDFIDIKNAFEWFNDTLVIIKPDAKPGGIAQIFDCNNDFKEFANKLIPNLNTGISKIDVEKRKLDEFFKNSGRKEINDIITDLKKQPNSFSTLVHSETGEEVSLVFENEEVFIKRLITSHLNDKGTDVQFSIGLESDGTKRLIEYIPALEGIINKKEVYLIDEIERSIHPIIIKEIISKISLDTLAKGQLIFTTHESCLLDQEILRPDEIWFAQKDIDGSSKIYSLSDFNIHNTANIENGYLNGRYGGIPFLSNLQDLNWHKYEVSE
jgi:uncharacterized protein